MATPIPSSLTLASSKHLLGSTIHLNLQTPTVKNLGFIAKCNSKGSDSEAEAESGVGNGSRFGIGSPIIVVEAPPTLKTADSMPCLKLNSGIVKQGDVGRIVSRKPKDVWAVRLTVGTYLLDGKYFKPLDLDE